MMVQYRRVRMMVQYRRVRMILETCTSSVPCFCTSAFCDIYIYIYGDGYNVYCSVTRMSTAILLAHE
jgi:hypothetical protein